VVKHVHAVELRVFVTAVLGVAADSVLVAQRLLKIGAHLVTALARLHVNNFARRSRLEAGSMPKKRAGRSEDT
jgi:type IV secretory pathway TrbF-like protein